MKTILGTLGGILLVIVLLALLFTDLPLLLITNNPRSGDSGGAYLTIEDKERIMDSSDSSRYLIWTEEGEVFENTDQLLVGKFDSSDIQGQLKVGSKYHCSTIGIRNQFFSWYRNIYDCMEVNE